MWRPVRSTFCWIEADMSWKTGSQKIYDRASFKESGRPGSTVECPEGGNDTDDWNRPLQFYRPAEGDGGRRLLQNAMRHARRTRASGAHLSFGVNEGRITLEQMCSYLAENPAKLYHLYPRKGAILPGSDADIVVWNPETAWILAAENQQSASGFCPMEGTQVKGRAEQVYLRGTWWRKMAR
mgnify:CR=1 FL=1